MKKTGMLLLLLISSTGFADQFLCSTNMQYVYTGDTLDSVIAACGQPTETRLEQAPSSSNNANLIWYYQLANTNNMGTSNNGFTASAGQLLPPSPAVSLNSSGLSLTTGTNTPVDLALLFNNGKVSSIQQSLNNTTQNTNSLSCANGNVQIGSSMSDVSAACGLPVFQKALNAAPTQNTSSAESSAATLLIYRPQSYLPPQIFVFKNGLLVGVK